MATHVRSNAWNHGGTFNNSDLLWYAKGVAVMQDRALDDPSSWWFFAAIHNEAIELDQFPGWRFIPGPPDVPVAPMPRRSVTDRFWRQCQHRSWYFLPWHRGYLIALEAHLRAAIAEKGGPATWALPYWNYFGPDAEFRMPPAFSARTLPDGSPNPLFIEARFGPEGDLDIFIPTRAVVEGRPTDPDFVFGPVTDESLSNTVFTGSDPRTAPPGFGGPETRFNTGAGTPGNLEGNPHDLTHVYIGGRPAGQQPPRRVAGLMTNPRTAALDPIFYLHHCNIDRMWEGWNAAGRANPSAANWASGPTTIGERKFVMPMPDGSEWEFTPGELDRLARGDYTYDNLPEVPSTDESVSQRLIRLGLPPGAMVADPVKEDPNYELVGATEEHDIALAATGARTSVRLAPAVRDQLRGSLVTAAADRPPDRVFLRLENVRGRDDASVLTVFVNLPEGASPGDHPELMAGSVGLFGLQEASEADTRHGGQGLDFVLEITEIVDRLHVQGAVLTEDTLRVTIVPHQPLPSDAGITVGRIGVYRQGT